MSVSNQANACPKCGAPVPSIAKHAKKAASTVWTVVKVGVALVLGLIVFSCAGVMSKLGDATPSSTPRAAAATATPIGSATSETGVRAIPVSTWDYQTSADPLTKKPTSFASLRSDDSLSLDFPYRGENHGTLWVRQSPRHGFDAFFKIEKGQLICGYGSDACRVKVSFNNGSPVSFSMSKPEDSNSTTLFFDDAKRFVKLASTAQEIRVAAVVYQAGEPTLTFKPTTPLAWPLK